MAPDWGRGRGIYCILMQIVVAGREDSPYIDRLMMKWLKCLSWIFFYGSRKKFKETSENFEK